jgi:cytochrome b6-f complex iron-sulfur subunit
MTESPMPGSTAGPEHPVADESLSEAVSRRRFLTLLLGVCASLGLAGLAAPVLRYLYPVKQAAVEPKVKVATVSQLKPLGAAVYFDYQEEPAALILEADGTPRAFYLACTHFGCITKWMEKDKFFFCPCHGGKFGPDGKVLGGPPPRPLQQLKVVKEGDALYVKGTVS